MRVALGFAIMMMTTANAVADVEVSFREGAPKDRFEIVNTSKCKLANAELVIDLNGSAGGLIFDVTATGAGVEVFQRFEVVAGNEFLTNEPQVKDGDRSLALSIGTLPAGGKIGFTIDVDDTANSREITVTDSELSGAKVVLRGANGTVEKAFGSRPSLKLDGSIC
ncbi:hypothetical protein [Ahrensia sp. R2A130]|uniref:hypothetical protein n=1 Tax=Ahrensia sp. R2A130 TaxID=744979 RepID=UPI0001E0D846|nr:hypothetical protein [Ahrensia sp. R2A130]EFL89292.1 aggregation factor core [Ahrensia sp. R2A130]